MVMHIGELMRGQGKQAEFTAYLADVKLRHKPKRNLMKLLAGMCFQELYTVFISSLAMAWLSSRMILSSALPKLSRLILPYHTIL